MSTPDWHTDAYPELRDGPPWVTEEMVAAQPGLPRPLLGAPPDAVRGLAGAVRDAHGAGLPVTVIGCGTSEHGAMAVAAMLDAALGGGWPPAVQARQSLDAAATPQRGGVCIGISHDGGTRATALALEAARAGGAATALITANPQAAGADTVVLTPLHDDSWCHTVAYTSTILAGAAVARELGLDGVDAGAAEAVLRAALERRPTAEALTGAERIVCVGTGVDLVTARELALKIAEGARIATACEHLETLLHGHLAGEDAGTGVVLIHTAGGRFDKRAALAASAVGEIGMPVLAIVGDDASAIPAAEHVVVPPPDGLHPVLARLLGGAAALQLVTLALVRARGVNPDLIRRDEEPYRRAGAAAEGGGGW